MAGFVPATYLISSECSSVQLSIGELASSLTHDWDVLSERSLFHDSEFAQPSQLILKIGSIQNRFTNAPSHQFTNSPISRGQAFD